MSGQLAPWMRDNYLADSIDHEYSIASAIRRFKVWSKFQSIRNKTGQLTIDDHISERLTGALELRPRSRDEIEID